MVQLACDALRYGAGDVTPDCERVGGGREAQETVEGGGQRAAGRGGGRGGVEVGL